MQHQWVFYFLILQVDFDTSFCIIYYYKILLFYAYFIHVCVVNCEDAHRMPERAGRECKG
jgi:hypothetical protein